jgi:uroporphyrinogen decarboxylase
MTSKERVLTAINHQQPDRVPIDIYPREEIWEHLVKHFEGRDTLGMLGVDFRSVYPEYVGPEIPVPEGCDTVDEFGVGYKSVHTGKCFNLEPAFLPWIELSTLEEVESAWWPTADLYDYSRVEERCDALAEFAIYTGSWGTPDINNGVSFGRGMQQVMVDIMTEDPVGVAIIEKRTECLYQRWERTLEAANGKIDILVMGEDTGNMTGPMYPPRVYDSFFRPRTQPFIDLAHKFGCKTLQHCCGANRSLMPKWIEMGHDVIMAQPEPHGMDPEGLKRDFGNDLTFIGMVSVQKTLPFGTEEECRAEARRLIEVVGRGGGYIFAPANLIQPDTPLNNILAMYEEAQGLPRGALIEWKL